MTPEGMKVEITNIRTENRAILASEDGELHLPDYEMVFTVNEAMNQVAASISKEE